MTAIKRLRAILRRIARDVLVETEFFQATLKEELRRTEADKQGQAHESDYMQNNN